MKNTDLANIANNQKVLSSIIMGIIIVATSIFNTGCSKTDDNDVKQSTDLRHDTTYVVHLQPDNKGIDPTNVYFTPQLNSVEDLNYLTANPSVRNVIIEPGIESSNVPTNAHAMKAVTERIRVFHKYSTKVVAGQGCFHDCIISDYNARQLFDTLGYRMGNNVKIVPASKVNNVSKQNGLSKAESYKRMHQTHLH